jgi:hypothetical protein
MLVSSKAAVEGTLDLSLSALDLKTKSGRGEATFVGKLRNAAGEMLFEGKVKVRAPKDVIVQAGKEPIVPGGSIEVVGTLPIPSRPDVSVQLSTSSERSAQRTVSGSYTQGSDTVLITLVAPEAPGGVSSVTLSTPTGVTATAKSTDKSFNIRKGNDVIGIVDVRKGRVDYVDDTYEQY